MLETLSNLGLGFSVALSPPILMYAFVGCLVGTLVGVLPGVGPLAGISLLLPATFGLDATRAIVMLAGIYYAPCTAARRRRSSCAFPARPPR